MTTPDTIGSVSARLDRLPATRTMWRLVALLSLGGFFEFYDLFFTGYIAPGLIRSGILSPSTRGLFGATGVANFVAAMFAGLFIGTALFGFLADRFGRRTIFTFSLLWYTISSLVMAFQSGFLGLNLWRFISGIGVGVELVTIDAYLAELVPKELRGRAFAFNQTIQFSSVPAVAFLSWLLVPRSPFGFDGWRWVVMIGAAGAVFVWWIRRNVPESPRWLAQQGRFDQAKSIVADLEMLVAAETGRLLPDPVGSDEAASRGRFGEIWKAPYRRRTVMLVVFNVFQTIGFYGFSNWVPAFLIKRGISMINSLEYTFLIAIAAPLGPVVAYKLGDRLERKWQIMLSALGVAVFGVGFARMTAAPLLIGFGILLTMSNNILSVAFHAYQAELYPTRIRTLAVGFVYSWSRLSVVFSAFIIAFLLDRLGVGGVFAFIAGSMVVVILAIGLLGPRTNSLALESISK